MRANVFRFTLKLGHRLMQSAGLKSANFRTSTRSNAKSALPPVNGHRQLDKLFPQRANSEVELADVDFRFTSAIRIWANK